MEALLEARRVTVRYGHMNALDEVSLAVTRGERVGLVGASGSGKSTLLHVLAGLIRPTSGMRVTGEPVTSEGYRALTLVVQHPSEIFSPRQSVEEFLYEPLHNFRLAHGAAATTAVRDALAQVELLPTVGEKYPHELSGGQLQRVVIARALLLRPACILFDEPTSALDVLTQASITDLIRRLQSAYGFASVFVSHDLGVVQEMSDRIAVMAAGRIVEELPAAQVRAARHPVTRQLVAADTFDRPFTDGAAGALFEHADGTRTERPVAEVAARPSVWRDVGPGHRVRVHISTTSEQQ